MKKTLIIGLTLAVFGFLGNLFELSGLEHTSWQDVYYKKADIAKGWKYIIVHHSATAVGSAKAFHKYHTDQGYGGLCYHFVIGNGKGAPDGSIEKGFRWKEQISGTHVDVNSWYHNIFGIGICLVGNFDKEKPTTKQALSLSKLINTLRKKYNIPKDNIMGHGQVPFGEMDWDAERINVLFEEGKTARTNCPGKNFPDLQELMLKNDTP